MSTRPYITFSTTTLPAYWASALVNGDYSGLSPAEDQRCNAAVDDLARDGWRIVDVVRDDDGEGADPRFTWHFDLYDPGAGVRGGDVLDYVIHRSRAWEASHAAP